jgi:hypothetical protein
MPATIADPIAMAAADGGPRSWTFAMIRGRAGGVKLQRRRMDGFVASRVELCPRCDCATNFVCVDLSGGAQTDPWRLQKEWRSGSRSCGRKCSGMLYSASGLEFLTVT